jgi:predicted nucleotide-binding protein (sugar kinase/HSP70/actin superfamily)
MWVIVKKTYAGPLGFFPGGNKHDLPKETVDGLRQKLGKENVVDTVAPWDEHLDHKAIKKQKAEESARLAITRIEAKQAEMKALREVAARINQLKKELDDEVPKAKQLAKQAGIDWHKKEKA